MQAQGTLYHAQDVSPSSWDAAKTCRSFPKGDLLKKLKVANESQTERTIRTTQHRITPQKGYTKPWRKLMVEALLWAVLTDGGVEIFCPSHMLITFM